MRQNEWIASIFLQNHDIGICFFTLKTLRVQCSSINSISIPGYKMLAELIQTSTTLLTNNPHHQILRHIDSTHLKTFTIHEKSFEYDIVQHNLARISSHMSSLKNPKAYFERMRQNKYKFNALGMFLYHLFNHSYQLQYKIYLDEIEYFNDTLFQLVQYSKTQLQFLEISKEDVHPSMIKGKGNSKEGYSILSAYESYMATTGSKRILRQMFLNPTYNVQILQKRLNIIQWMKTNMKDYNQYNRYFKNIHAMNAVLKKFGASPDEEDWKRLMRTLEAMLELKKLISYQSIPADVAQYVQDSNWDDLTEIINVLKETISFDPFIIKKGINANLDHLRQIYDSMSHTLTLVASQQHWDIDFRIIFMNQVGYLIKINQKTQFPEGFDTEQWIMQFSNTSGKYYSNNLTQALDTQYGDIFGQIQDIEKKIVFDMQNLIVERQEIILQLYWKVCFVQCFWGISQASKNMSRPKLSSQALIVSNGWHVLLTGTIVQNHAFSFCQSQAPRLHVTNSEKNIVNMNYSNRCMIITGPNASGKTIYIKQLGIIIYLAHLGFYVPATIAQIPLIDSILFVGKSESLYNVTQSGFFSQLRILSSISLPNVISNKSLILIDEIGGQIDYQNSLRLLYTMIKYLTNQKGNFYQNRILTKTRDEFQTPIVLIITHLLEIMHSKIVQENYMVRFLTMSMQEKGVSLFKIKPGLVAKGYGIQSASQIMAPSFIKISKKYYELIHDQ